MSSQLGHDMIKNSSLKALELGGIGARRSCSEMLPARFHKEMQSTGKCNVLKSGKL